MKQRLTIPALFFAALLTSCASTELGGSDFQVYETKSGSRIELATMVQGLQHADVVFLGEEHDNDVGHRLQLETVMALAALRPDLIVTMEQFEADVQSELDLFMAGAISEEEFLANSRPWENYAEHYRPIVEFAKSNGIQVIAANIPRPVARIVAYEGLAAIAEERIASPLTWTNEPQYGQFFARAMGREAMDPEDQGLERWFAAQCVKDEKMAESISRALVRSWAEGKRPLVVHLNGKFHSNNGLGTVSRLQRRHARLDIMLVGMNSDSDRERELGNDELEEGNYIWLVQPQP